MVSKIIKNNKKWEYKILTINHFKKGYDAEIEDSFLDEPGEEGWELVSATPFIQNGYTAGLRLFFKRVI